MRTLEGKRQRKQHEFQANNKIKKSNLPAPLKRVLEAYVSFGNSDGTNIRPTANAVADRITGSRTTVARYTPKLVRLGLLIHDRNEDGTCKTHSYNSTGTWAYVYTTPTCLRCRAQKSRQGSR